MDSDLVIVPANEVSWEDLQTIFGDRGEPARCQCQWFRTSGRDFRQLPSEERRFRLREQTDCGNPGSDQTSGLVAHLHGEPVGWCAVEPRSVYVHLHGMRVPWADRVEDKNDGSVWAVTCFVTRVGYRRRGVATALAAATVDFARERGARALEAYPMIVRPDEEFTWGELYVGSRGMFSDAGFHQVAHPTTRRVVMRIDF